MKRIKLVVLSLAALVFARPAGLSTANAKSDSGAAEAAAETAIAASAANAEEIAALKARLEEQAAEIARLHAATATRPAPEENLGALGLLAKGAGVPIDDVRWRVQNGLDPEQAVEAAALQQLENARAAAAAAEKGDAR